MLLNIDRINLNGGTQTRESLNGEHVANLVEQLDDGYVLPPVGLVYDGTSYWLWDGFHRVSAHKLADKKRIAVKITQGTLRDATLLSLGANATHGLPRNNGDRKRAVMRMLCDDEWSEWPDSKIAKTCACTIGYVKRIRLETFPTIPGLEVALASELDADETNEQPLKPATPGASVDVGGRAGTLMNITDSGAIFEVMVDGKLMPLLRNEFTVTSSQPQPPKKPDRLSKNQQILELRRFVASIAKSDEIPESFRQRASSVLELTN